MIRRAIDILVSALALIVLSPLLAAVALAVAIDSPGNPFYLAARSGLGGRTFRMFKFRTMVRDAAKLSAITGAQDPRVTRIGRLLRKTKIDELPQFINVLAGQMTLVGPRPEAPSIVAGYSERQRRVLAVKPGITGRVQLDSGDEAESIPEGVDAEQYYIRYLMDKKLERDLEYLQGRTPLSDARIVMETAAMVFRAIVQ